MRSILDLAARLADDPTPRSDLIISCGVWLGLVAVAFAVNWPIPTQLNMAFGYEYGNVGESLVRGEGFANPFGGHTGPTAWMPPMFCWLFALNFALFGIKTITALWVALGIKYAMVAASLFLLLRLAVTTAYGRFRHLLVPAMLLPATAYPKALFRELHDVECVMLLSVLLLTVVHALWKHGAKGLYKTRCVLAIVLPLAHPGLAFVFVVFMVAYAAWCLCVRFRKNVRQAIPELRSVVITAILFCTSAGFWTLRNELALHAFIPIKSNFWYEYYQVNVQNYRGVVTASVSLLCHPIHFRVAFDRYQNEGEVAFLHDYEVQSEKARITRAQMCRRILQRASNALLCLESPDDIWTVNVNELNTEDVQRLVDAHLIVLDTGTHQWFWTCNLAPADFEAQLSRLQLHAPAIATRSWTEGRYFYLKRLHSWPRFLVGIVVTSVPLGLALVALCFTPVRREPLFWTAAAIYGLYLTPYILVTHYVRYQLPMIGIQSVFTFFSAAAVLNMILQHRQQRIENQPSIEDPLAAE